MVVRELNIHQGSKDLMNRSGSISNEWPTKECKQGCDIIRFVFYNTAPNVTVDIENSIKEQ